LWLGLVVRVVGVARGKILILIQGCTTAVVVATVAANVIIVAASCGHRNRIQGAVFDPLTGSEKINVELKFLKTYVPALG